GSDPLNLVVHREPSGFSPVRTPARGEGARSPFDPSIVGRCGNDAWLSRIQGKSRVGRSNSDCSSRPYLLRGRPERNRPPNSRGNGCVLAPDGPPENLVELEVVNAVVLVEVH